MEIVQKKHGNPNIILIDRDPIFTVNLWIQLFPCLGAQLAHNSYYHPQSDGKTEILYKCLEVYLHFFASDKQTKWVKWFPSAGRWYNTYVHTS